MYYFAYPQRKHKARGANKRKKLGHFLYSRNEAVGRSFEKAWC